MQQKLPDCGLIEKNKFMNSKKELFATLALLFAPLIASAQNKYRDEPDIHETAAEKDRNHAEETFSDNTFNYGPAWCCTLDGEYIGPHAIGIDLYAAERVRDSARYVPDGQRFPYVVRGIGPNGDSLTVYKNPFSYEDEDGKYYMIGADRISMFINYKSLKGPVELISLEDVRRTYCSEVEGRHVFMINKFFIMRNEELYKIDKDFIYKVETVDSKDIEALKDLGEFTVIRIFTRTHHNWHRRHLGGGDDARAHRPRR